MPLLTDRAKLAQNPTAKRAFQLMEEKQSRLVLSADATKQEELLSLAEQAGPYIVALKTHIDILEDYDPQVTRQLVQLSKKHSFLLFEDRKFADIGNTVRQQYAGGIFRIAEWADITNAHVLPGPGIIEGLKAEGLKRGRGLLLLAEMSTQGSLATGTYTKRAIEMAESQPEFVIGFIGQTRLTNNPAHIVMTPGVCLENGSDALGQQYNTPMQVLKERMCDLMIVGRGITRAKNPTEAVKAYLKAGQKAV